ncbi:MAG TPA: hypothetical protein VFU05_08925, partial [Cyclobacteriaceae bacterium]|nr:hypothetical protein [Cyclobacteriaceae bacterium]
LLSKRSVVLYSYLLTQKEISSTHENLIRTGIDAIAYFKTDGVVAGGDVIFSYAEYFKRREVSNLLIIQKSKAGYTIYITSFNGKEDLVSADQSAWQTQSPTLSEALASVYRSALASNKKKNFLINEIPETDLPVKVIGGQRSENFAYDLKVDNLAIPKFNDAVLDKELEELLKTYPLRNQLVSHDVSDKELRTQGFLYVLCFVNTRSGMARELLGYPVRKSESAFVSVSYLGGPVQLKTIPADTPVFKFYVRHIDSGNVYLGTKWDAETTWQQALQNFIKGFKAELRL